MNARVKITVKGVVQGVGFRWFVEREANKLQLMGYVKNLYNGDVEAEVEGADGLIKDFIRTVKIGNSSSRVSGADVEWKEYSGKYSSFNIRF